MAAVCSYFKGVPFSVEGVWKWYLFTVKNGITGKVLDLGGPLYPVAKSNHVKIFRLCKRQNVIFTFMQKSRRFEGVKLQKFDMNIAYHVWRWRDKISDKMGLSIQNATTKLRSTFAGTLKESEIKILKIIHESRQIQLFVHRSRISQKLS